MADNIGNNLLTIKAVVHPGASVKKFSVAANSSLSDVKHTLLQRIKLEIDENDIELSYVDDEGDWVLMTVEEEWQEAVHVCLTTMPKPKLLVMAKLRGISGKITHKHHILANSKSDNKHHHHGESKKTWNNKSSNRFLTLHPSLLLDVVDSEILSKATTNESENVFPDGQFESESVTEEDLVSIQTFVDNNIIQPSEIEIESETAQIHNEDEMVDDTKLTQDSLDELNEEVKQEMQFEVQQKIEADLNSKKEKHNFMLVEQEMEGLCVDTSDTATKTNSDNPLYNAFYKELRDLAEMGLSDEKLNIKLLCEHNGCIPRVVERYFQIKSM